MSNIIPEKYAISNTCSNTVYDLLAGADLNCVCDIIQKQLKIADTESDAVRSYFGELLKKLKGLTPNPTEMYFLAFYAYDGKAYTMVLTEEQYCSILSLEGPDLGKELTDQKGALKIKPWEDVLGMGIIVFPEYAENTDLQHMEHQVAADLLLDISFLGADLDTRNSSIKSLKRKLAITEDDDSKIFVPRVLPWFTKEAVVDVKTIISNMKKDTHYTLYGVFADIWGVPDWTAADYVFLTTLFAAPYWVRNKELTISVYYDQKNRYTESDIHACLEQIEQRYVWMYVDGQPYCAKLIHSHRIDDKGVVHVTLDNNLRRLYDHLNKHLNNPMWSQAVASLSVDRMCSVALIELMTTYHEFETGKVSVPEEVLNRNLPYEE